MLPKQLSKADARVLAQVFDPESGPATAEIIVNPSLPTDPKVQDDTLLSELRTTERRAILLVEKCEKSPNPVEGKDRCYQEALQILDRLVLEHPDYASARNNRAQLRRWRYGDRNALVQPRGKVSPLLAESGASSVEDLRQAIALASPAGPQGAVSPAQGRLLAQAHTQLAALYYAASKDLGELDGELWSKAAIEHCSKDELEEESSRHFYSGGLYGNEVAKALAVHTNPHAKLCGSIVREAMRKELVV